MVALMAAPTVERKFTSGTGTFTVEELDEQLVPALRRALPRQNYAAYSVAELDTTGVQTLNR